MIISDFVLIFPLYFPLRRHQVSHFFAWASYEILDNLLGSKTPHQF
jgi:hypothetical protein